MAAKRLSKQASMPLPCNKCLKCMAATYVVWLYATFLWLISGSRQKSTGIPDFRSPILHTPGITMHRVCRIGPLKPHDSLPGIPHLRFLRCVSMLQCGPEVGTNKLLTGGSSLGITPEVVSYSSATPRLGPTFSWLLISAPGSHCSWLKKLGAGTYNQVISGPSPKTPL